MVSEVDRVREQALSLLLEGLSASRVGIRLGVSRWRVRRWAKLAGMTLKHGDGGGVVVTPPVSRPASAGAGRLTLTARVLIQVRCADGWSLRQIAAEARVTPATVCRELARNGGRNRYDAHAAEARAMRQRARPKPRRLDVCAELRAEVVARLRRHDSPQQIAGRLRCDFPDRHDMWVSHETIYQALYVQGKGSLREEIDRDRVLRSGRTARVKASRLAARKRSWVSEEDHISHRPPEADDRRVPGHWEGDLIIGKGRQSCLITLAERSSRFVLLHRLPTHETDTVVAALQTMISDLPTALMRSLTWDNGAEMAGHARFSVETGCPVYFCDPHSPWQRGTNENTNRLVREFFPKTTDFTKVTDEEVAWVQDNLNTRPRQTLAFATPAETLDQQIVALTA